MTYNVFGRTLSLTQSIITVQELSLLKMIILIVIKIIIIIKSDRQEGLFIFQRLTILDCGAEQNKVT